MILSQTPSLQLQQRLTQEQRLSIQSQQLGLRIELAGELRGERYEPTASCFECGRKLTPGEILQGFNDNPHDFTTRCSGCGHRFEPKLVCFSGRSTLELPFFCDIQTLDQLPGKENLSPEQLSRLHPAIYRAAIIHHGTIRKAFKEIGINYEFKEIPEWKNKVTAFLGRLPDTVIAKCVNVPATTIRSMRKKLNIDRYTAAVALAEI